MKVSSLRVALAALFLFCVTSVRVEAMPVWIGSVNGIGTASDGTCSALDGSSYACLAEWIEQLALRSPSCSPVALGSASSLQMSSSVGSSISFTVTGPCAASHALYTVETPIDPGLGMRDKDLLWTIALALNIVIFSLGFIGGQQR